MFKQNKTKFLLIILVLAFLFCSSGLSAFSKPSSTDFFSMADDLNHFIDDIDNVDFKFDHAPSLKEDFADDEVIVTLKHAYSKVNQKIVFGDIKNIRLDSVTDLTFVDEKLIAEVDGMRFAEMQQTPKNIP